MHFWAFLVEILSFEIFDQKSISGLWSAFLVEKVNFHFFDKKSIFGLLKGILDIFGRETELCFTHQKSIFTSGAHFSLFLIEK